MVKKMFDSRKQNPSCSFGEEVVSYLYDEMADSIKLDFETHLSDCSSCPGEIAAFGAVRSTMQEWREVEFDSLTTPEFVIPHESDKTIQTLVSSEESKTWFGNLSALLSFSPMFAKTATGFAAVLIMLGMGWFLFGSLLKQDVTTAGKQNKPGADQKNITTQTQNSVEIAKEEVKKSPDPITVDKKPPTTTNAPIKVSHQRVNKKKGKTLNRKNKRPRKKTRPAKTKRQEPVIINEMPRLTETLAIEESDKDEIRLTDLLDDVGSDK